MNSRSQSYFVYFLLIIAIGAMFYMGFRDTASSPEALTLSDLARQVQAGQVGRIIIGNDDVIRVVSLDGTESDAVESRKEPDTTLVDQLRSFGVTPEQLATVDIEVSAPSVWTGVLSGAFYILPVLLMGGVLWFIFRQAQGSNNAAMSFGKSRARMFSGEHPTVTFADVAGADESKQELAEVVEFLKEPQKFIQLGARIPKGVLLVGPPGTGKTLLAKAVSGEAGVPFFSISGSEFVEMFVGVGASRVRDLFDQAKRHSPCIIFVDEIDAVGRQRGAGLGGSHDEREQTLNQMLVEMDGFDTDTNVIIIAATNRPDILDPALLRPGRFDRRVVMDRPDVNGRKAILQVHVRGKPLAPDVQLDVLAKQIPGFVGADIENLVNEAAILAARRNKKVIEMDDFQESVERVMAGPERKSRLISDEEKKVIAYHEAGKALARSQLAYCDPVHKVSIISRGLNMGYTLALPEEDAILVSRLKFRDELVALLAGRAAENLVFDEAWTWNSANDSLERATQLARRMVTEFGMSEKLGPLTFGHKDEMVFLGRDIGEQRNYGEEVARSIDREVRALIWEAYERGRAILTQHRPALELIAERLVEAETLDAPEFQALLDEAIAAETPAGEPA